MSCPVCESSGVVTTRPATDTNTFGVVADCPRCDGTIPVIDIRKVTT